MTVCRAALSPDKIFPPVSLRVEQRGEIAVIDPRCGGGGDRRLGVVGHAQSGMFDHVEVVGAIADRKRVDVVEVEGFEQVDEGCKFRGAAEHRLRHFAGQLAVANDEPIGAVLLKSDHIGHNAGE
jgi:hypothetical protein